MGNPIVGYFTDTWKDRENDRLFRGVENLAVGLATNPPARTGVIFELRSQDTGYARVSIPPDVWAPSRGGLVTNTRDLVFPAPSADWIDERGRSEILSGFLVNDRGMVICMWLIPSAPFVVRAGDPPKRFAAGALSIQR